MMNRSLIAASSTTVVVLVLAGLLVPAHASSDGAALFENCDERFFWGLGENVDAIQGSVPANYELVRESASELPLLRVAAQRCERVSVPGGEFRPTTTALFTAVIASPDGAGCFSNAPVVGDLAGDVPSGCNQYLLFWATDNAEFVEWASDGLADPPFILVEDLTFQQGGLDAAALGTPFHFVAEASTPSPFELDLVIRDRPAGIPVHAGFWHDDAIGTLKMIFESTDVTLGEATGSLQVGAGSEMARLYGTRTPSASGVHQRSAGAIHWSRGELRREIAVAA